MPIGDLTLDLTPDLTPDLTLELDMTEGIQLQVAYIQFMTGRCRPLSAKP